MKALTDKQQEVLANTCFYFRHTGKMSPILFFLTFCAGHICHTMKEIGDEEMIEASKKLFNAIACTHDGYAPFKEEMWKVYGSTVGLLLASAENSAETVCINHQFISALSTFLRGLCTEGLSEVLPTDERAATLELLRDHAIDIRAASDTFDSTLRAMVTA